MRFRASFLGSVQQTRLCSYVRDGASGASTAFADAVMHLPALRERCSKIYHSDDDEAAAFVVDWTRRYRQTAGVVALPASTSELSSILAFCHAKRIAVVPQGGNTGLVGGGVGSPGSLIVSLARMNRVEKVDADAGILVCEAGCVLQTLQQAVSRYGFAMPLDMGSKGQCQIGGNIATNAGGLNVIKYGGLSRYVLGLEVVTADGTVLNMLRQLPKDNMGLQIPRLFIGSEGILGIITRVSLLLVPLPKHTTVALVKLSSFALVQKLLTSARGAFGDSIGAFEFWDAASAKAVHEAQPKLLQALSGLGVDDAKESTESSPSSSSTSQNVSASASVVNAHSMPGLFGIIGEVHVLIQVVSSATDLREALVEWVSQQVDGGLALERGTTVSQSSAQERHLWAFREAIPMCLSQLSLQQALHRYHAKSTAVEKPPPAVGMGRLYKYDISLPLADMSKVVAEVQARLAETGFDSTGTASGGKPSGLNVEVVCFGHCGDLNLHLNILARAAAAGAAADALPAVATIHSDLDRLQVVLDAAVSQAVSGLQGSLSAEHAVGQLKRKYMPLARSAEEIAIMRGIKDVFDPKGIMNPGKVL